MTRRPDSSGYSPGPDPEDQPPPIQKVELDRKETMYTDEILVQLRLDGENRGLITFKTEEEYRWFRAQIPEERTREDEEIQRLMERS